MSQLTDKELERLACEELLQEAKRGAARVESEGSMGWLKNSQPKTNKRFLQNTLVNTVMFNKAKQRDVEVEERNVQNFDSRRKHRLELNVEEKAHYKLRKK